MDEEILQIDSSVILETLLEQQRAEEGVRLFNLCARENRKVAVIAFSLYSVEIIACRHELYARLDDWLEKLKGLSGLTVYHTSIEEEREVARLVQTSRLDFDDALQYYVAKKTGAHLVSYDKDFDRTDIRRVTPEEILTTL